MSISSEVFISVRVSSVGRFMKWLVTKGMPTRVDDSFDDNPGEHQ